MGKQTRKMTMVMELLEGVETSISIYEQECKDNSYPPVAGYGNLTIEDSRTSICRRIMVAREELLKISKAIGGVE